MKKTLSSVALGLIAFTFNLLVLSSEANAQTTGTCTLNPGATATCPTGNAVIQGNCPTGCTWTSNGITVTGNANQNAFVDTICNVLRIVTGNGGKAFAAFAIISLGIGFFSGKVSWGLMIGVACGIAAMFGAPTIVAAISGESSFDCGS